MPYPEANYHKIRHWLSPPNFAEVLQTSQELREDGTNNWLFGKDIFNTWRKSIVLPESAYNQKKMNGNVLWIHGKTLLWGSVRYPVVPPACKYALLFDPKYAY